MEPLPFIPKDDPLLPLPSEEEMRKAIEHHPKEFRLWLENRQQAIEKRQRDPLRHGYEPDIWHVVDDLLCRGVKVQLVDPTGVPRDIMGGSEVLILGSNRSGKTEFVARTLVRLQVQKANARTWSFHTTGKTSIAIQQPRFWQYLPPEWKGAKGKLKSGHIGSISYNQKGGFTQETYVLPNGSQHWFLNYAQDIDVIEGEELDGAATDELVPLQVIETLRYRLATRNGILIICFTPIEHYSPTVRALLQGAETVLEVPAKHLPTVDGEGRQNGWEMVPRVQQAMDPNLKIVYYHVEADNPFGNAAEVLSKAKARGREEILCRMYGVPTKSTDTQFPLFRRSVHVIDDQTVPKEGTNYLFMDPCSGRNWAMIWVRALPDEQTIVIYREWPSESRYIEGVGFPGPWAEPDGHKLDGKRGPAQAPWGFGLERYREEILSCEGWKRTNRRIEMRSGSVVEFQDTGDVENMWERYIDSRFGAAPTLAHSESKTLIDSLAEIEMYFEPAPGEHQQEGIDQLNTLLYYDIREPIGPLNKPRLLIARSCTNMIFAFQEWTGRDGKHGASKDFIDLGRYMALVGPQYITNDMLKVRSGGSYGGGL